jgi:hypothetical protein
MAELDWNLDASVHAEAQQFEHGWIMRLRLPRPGAPTQWYLLVDDGRLNQYWSFTTPAAFLGTDSPVYSSWEHQPPQGTELPDMAFSSLWVAMKDVLGWATGAKQVYEIPAALTHINPLTHPDLLIGPDALEFRLDDDSSWIACTPLPTPDTA